MLVALINVVKVESVPLNLNQFSPRRACSFMPRHAAVCVPTCTFARSASLVATRLRTYDRTVGQQPSIGYNGQPVREPFRLVRPPVAVLVDLTVLFPRQPHRDGRYHPHGLQMHKVVEGRLSCWGICEQGDWWGLVTYEIAYGSRRKRSLIGCRPGPCAANAKSLKRTAR